jgi:hypothetical protein
MVVAKYFALVSRTATAGENVARLAIASLRLACSSYRLSAFFSFRRLHRIEIVEFFLYLVALLYERFHLLIERAISPSKSARRGGAFMVVLFRVAERFDTRQNTPMMPVRALSAL